MGKSAWPTVAEVTAALAGYGSAGVPAGFDVQDEIDSAVATCERVTGYRPFLASGPDVSVLENGGEGGLVDLHRPFAVVTSVAVSGEALNADDWEAGPQAEAPFRFLKLFVGIPNRKRCVTVTGKRGFGTEIPEDVWGAVQDLAVSKLLGAALATGLASGEIEEARQDSVSVRYVRSREQGDLAERLRMRSLDTLNGYGLMGMGG